VRVPASVVSVCVPARAAMQCADVPPAVGAPASHSGGSRLEFGMTMVRTGEKDEKQKNAKWKRAEVPSDVFDGRWERDAYVMEYMPQVAGAFSLHLWARERQESFSKASRHAKSSKEPSNKAGRSSAEAKEAAEAARSGREALPGSPFRLIVCPADADATGSYVDGFSKAVEKVEHDKVGIGKKGPDASPSATPPLIRAGTSNANSPGAPHGETLLESGSLVGAGETIVIRPNVRDRFGNAVMAPEGALRMAVAEIANTSADADDGDEDTLGTATPILVTQQTRGDTTTCTTPTHTNRPLRLCCVRDSCTRWPERGGCRLSLLMHADEGRYTPKARSNARFGRFAIHAHILSHLLTTRSWPHALRAAARPVQPGHSAGWRAYYWLAADL
jgi:hypothetical protein